MRHSLIRRCRGSWIGWVLSIVVCLGCQGEQAKQSAADGVAQGDSGRDGDLSSAEAERTRMPDILRDDDFVSPPDVLVESEPVTRMQLAEGKGDAAGAENGAQPVPEPEALSEIEVPSEVEVPAGVAIPVGPTEPEVPNEPIEPEVPNEPTEPEVPIEPSESEMPTEPALPTVDGETPQVVPPVSAAGAVSTPALNDEAGQPETLDDWPMPQVALVISGHQHGYIEPCGCTGLDRQKGGMMRRATFLAGLRDRGWEVLPMDAGNQIRGTGRQAAIKFQTSVKGLTEMGYRVIGFGPDDLGLGASELLSVAASDGDQGSLFATANVELLAPDLVPTEQQIEIAGRKIGVTTALDGKTLESPIDSAIIVSELKEKLLGVLQKFTEASCDFRVLLLYGSPESARQIAKEVPGFDLIVAAATVGEPTYQAELIEGTESRLIVTGDKGMYVGVVGLFADEPFRYSRVALTSEFEDAPEMQRLMAAYQEQLKSLGLEGLQVRPIAHPSGGEFIGSKACGECHTTAYSIWEGTPHAEATEHIVHPGERSEVPRHFDPECLSCHVTGWNPQRYYPYTSGYLSLETTPMMTGNGCENCHGPGKAHAEAERAGSGLSDEEIAQLREAVRLTLDKAREKCLECHDLDNSPDFHLEGAFEDYWGQVEHYGVD